MLPLPFKLNHAGRHHIPRQKRKVTNWPAYDASLRQRGSLTVWFTDAAIAAWQAEPRTTRGGQPWYSELTILTALTLRAAYRLALRQTEGLIGSLMRLLGLDLPVPDHTTLSRRAATLEVLTLATVPSPCTSWWTAWASSSVGPVMHFHLPTCVGETTAVRRIGCGPCTATVLSALDLASGLCRVICTERIGPTRPRDGHGLGLGGATMCAAAPFRLDRTLESMR